jgi:hypothetical protein
MVLIHKKGAKRNIKNYRPITLINQLLKAWEKIIDHRLEEHMTAIGSPARTQGVGRKHRGATDAVKKVMKMYEGRKKALMTIIDYSKAYDRCERTTMEAIMIKRGIKGRLLQAILSTYKDCSLKIKIQGTISKEFTIPEGLKQGSVLSPRLFILYIDQLLIELEDSNTGMEYIDPLTGRNDKQPGAAFMDDLLLSPKDTKELTTQMEILRRFTVNYGCVINMEKGITILQRGLKKETESWMERNPKFNSKIAKHTTYLGVELTLWASPYRWNKHVESRCAKARGTAWALKRKGVNNKDLGIKTALKLYESHIIPIMLYGTEVTELTEKNYETIDKCQKTILGTIIGFRWCTPTRWTLTESGSLPAKIRVDIRKLGNWFKQTKEEKKKRKQNEIQGESLSIQDDNMKQRLNEWGIERWIEGRKLTPSKKAFKVEIAERTKIHTQTWLEKQHDDKEDKPVLLREEKHGPISPHITNLKQNLQSAIIDARADTMGFSNDERGSKTSWAGTRCNCWEAKEDTLGHAINCKDAPSSLKRLIEAAIDVWPSKIRERWLNMKSEKQQIQKLLMIDDNNIREKRRIKAVARCMLEVQKEAERKWKQHIDKRTDAIGNTLLKIRKKNK